MNKDDRLEITIKYNDYKQTIIGSPERVSKEYFNVLSKIIPALDSVAGLVIGPDLTNMVTKLKGSVNLYKDSFYFKGVRHNRRCTLVVFDN